MSSCECWLKLKSGFRAESLLSCTKTKHFFVYSSFSSDRKWFVRTEEASVLLRHVSASDLSVFCFFSCTVCLTANAARLDSCPPSNPGRPRLRGVVLAPLLMFLWGGGRFVQLSNAFTPAARVGNDWALVGGRQGNGRTMTRKVNDRFTSETNLLPNRFRLFQRAVCLLAAEIWTLLTCHLHLVNKVIVLFCCLWLNQVEFSSLKTAH